MKALLTPVYFNNADDPDFVKQIGHLKLLLADEADLQDPVKLGQSIPPSDGVIFPDLLGDAYQRLEDIKKLPQPVMVITSEFGTVSMWDWEINSYLISNGVSVVAPNTLEKAKVACRAFALKRELHDSKFLTYQDHPASQGKQDEIFKRFYWWEKECTETIRNQFGLQIVQKSMKKLAEEARLIPDKDAKEFWEGRKSDIPHAPLREEVILGAIKLYLAIKKDLDDTPKVIAAGMNCLNESHLYTTTPCLAWNLLYEDDRLVWGCEADTVAMLTKVLIEKTLDTPYMMTNMYPFLMGEAATKHERIPGFPIVDGNPDNYILAAHCGYFGVIPQSFSTKWKLKEKVLAIVDKDAHAIDGQMEEGPICLVKLMPPFNRWSVIEGEIVKFAQFKNSDCLNGAVIRVKNGPKMIDGLASHHYIITQGHNLNILDMVSKVFGISIETVD